MDLALNNLQRLICHKTQQTNQLKDNNFREKSYRLVEESFGISKDSKIDTLSAGAVEYSDCTSAEG